MNIQVMFLVSQPYSQKRRRWSLNKHTTGGHVCIFHNPGALPDLMFPGILQDVEELLSHSEV